MHTNLFTDEEAGSYQRGDGADNHQQIADGEGIDQFLPRSDRHTNGKQNRVGHGGLEEFVDYLRTFQQAWGRAVAELHQHRHKQHANRCWQANQLVTEHTQHVEQHRQQCAGSNRGDVGFAGESRLRHVSVGISAVWHQLAFASQVRIAFAQLVQAAGDNNGG
ncbi:hypothetical protein D3C72_799620 [compost metagenome]